MAKKKKVSKTRRGPRGSTPRSRQPAGGASLSPARLLQLGLGFWASRAFLSAVDLGVFSVLAERAQDEKTLRERLGLHARAARDFFDTLVALGVLTRKAGRYRNVPDADAFLDRAKPSYAGGMLEMASARLYPFWGSLTEALRTGLPQNEIKRGGDLFGELYGDPQRLQGFLSAMTGVSMGAARAIAAKFPWHERQTFIDVGGAQGCVPVQLALHHKHLTGGAFDLPAVQPIYEKYVRSFGLDSRLKFLPGDFFRDPLPQSEVLIMGHILHDWNLEQKHLLLQKAYAALPKGGALIVYDAMIDDARSTHAGGLLMSLNMLIETPGGFDYTAADCKGWMKSTGFRKATAVPLSAMDTMVVAIR
jgi:hypothetical protein